MVGLVWTNNIIALTMDIVLGLSVMTDNGWSPIRFLDKEIVKKVIGMIDFNPSFPKDWMKELNGLVQ